MGRVNGKVAVITGGASGIGAATVRLFVQVNGHALVVDGGMTGGRMWSAAQAGFAQLAAAMGVTR